MANQRRRFPFLVPTRRSYTPGRYPQTMFEAQNGAVSVMRYSSKSVNAQLQLVFENISDDEADQLIDHYNSVNDDWDYAFFDARDPALAGMSNPLRQNIDGEPGGLRWRYTEPPSITSVFPGVSTVECNLQAYLDG